MIGNGMRIAAWLCPDRLALWVLNATTPGAKAPLFSSVVERQA
jgi:hypothetical protein